LFVVLFLSLSLFLLLLMITSRFFVLFVLLFVCLFVCFSSGHIELLKLLIEHRADANYQNTFPGYTALHLSCANGQLPCTEFLIAIGANTDTRSRTLTSPLHLAVKNGHVSIVKMLVKLKPPFRPDVNARDEQGLFLLLFWFWFVFCRYCCSMVFTLPTSLLIYLSINVLFSFS